MDRGELEKVFEEGYFMPKYEVEVHWNPSTIVQVEADDREEAEQLAIAEAGQPEVDHCVVTELPAEEETEEEED